MPAGTAARSVPICFLSAYRDVDCVSHFKRSGMAVAALISIVTLRNLDGSADHGWHRVGQTGIRSSSQAVPRCPKGSHETHDRPYPACSAVDGVRRRPDRRTLSGSFFGADLQPTLSGLSGL